MMGASLARVRGAAALAVVLGSALAWADTHGWDAYTDWYGWARVGGGMHAGLASSYDRAGENDDFSQYEYPPGLILDPIPCTVRTLAGPGCVQRFWMPHLTSDRSFVVRMFFDGETTPRIDTTSDVLLGGSYAYFQPPLVDTFAGGKVCYGPIPFAQSLRIETVNKLIPPEEWSGNRHYYQYGFVLYPPGTAVESYDGSLSPEEQAARAAVMALFGSAGQHPGGSNPAAVRVTTPAQTIGAGQTLTLASLNGPGLIRQLNVQMNAPTDADLAGLHLSVCYDTDSAPAIDVAIGDFFGAGRGRVLYQSLPLGTDSADGFYCYWPMPFRQAVVVELHNASEAPIAIDGGVVEYEASEIDPALCYLHAVVRTSVQHAGDIRHTLLATTGCGHYVGNLLYVEQDGGGLAMLEGDDIITVDGTETLSGTGLEDAYNGGYYYNWVVAQPDEPEGAQPSAAIRPLSGILHVEHDAGNGHTRADQYRWLIADRIPFTSSIQVEIESRYSIAGARWSSVAFWYQLPRSPGDLNCDGTADFGDINPFVLALSDPAGYVAMFPFCSIMNGDINGDGIVDFGDINPFVALLTGWARGRGGVMLPP